MALQCSWGRNIILVGRVNHIFQQNRQFLGSQHARSDCLGAHLRHDSSLVWCHCEYHGTTARSEALQRKCCGPLWLSGSNNQRLFLKRKEFPHGYSSPCAVVPPVTVVGVGDIFGCDRQQRQFGTVMQNTLIHVYLARAAFIVSRAQPTQVRLISTKRRRYFKMRKFHKKKYKKRLMRSNKVPFVDIDKPKRTWKTLRETQRTRKTFRRGIPGKGARMLRLKRQR